jgi:hypothetical protein
MSGREFGGATGRNIPKIVSTLDQKLWGYAIPFENYLGDDIPIPEGDILNTFETKGCFEMNLLRQLHEQYVEAQTEKKNAEPPVKLKKKQVKKRVEKAQENDEQDSDDDSGDEQEPPSTPGNEETDN